MKEELSEYEIKRLERIKRNKAMLDSLFPDLSPKKQLQVKSKSSGEKKKERRRRNSAPYEKKPLLIRRNPARDARTSVSLCPEGAIISDPTEPGMLDDDYFDGVMGSKMKSGKLSKSLVLEEIVFDEEDDDDVTSYSESARQVAFHVSDKVYNKQLGTSCHQCRQKTLDLKTRCKNVNCRGVRGQFCGVCLLNRYGEDAVEAIEDKRWVCPPCRGCCNCSFCLPKRGKRPTGVLTPFIKARGFNNVKEYLASFDEDDMEDEDDVEFEQDEDKENIDPLSASNQTKIRITAHAPLAPRTAPLAPRTAPLYSVSTVSTVSEIRASTVSSVSTVSEIRASTERLDISSEEVSKMTPTVDREDCDGAVVTSDSSPGDIEAMIPLPNKKMVKQSPKHHNTVKRCLVVWETGRYTGGYQWLHPSKVTDLDYTKPQIGGIVQVKWGKSAKHSPATLMQVESLVKKIGMLSGA